ncbi:hypothetical protein EBH_0049760 [Eimeria brunetti]|uniref:Transmembrane protein n=1 Tax=Eimeria brunetti TaxID=51314 RepID=U6LXE1_9EIME|nr:hypothetical protein EBH_0049760 [Eimeria brunetti]
MVAASHFGESSFAPYASSVHDVSATLKGHATIHRRDELQGAASMAVPPSRAQRSLLVALASVLAILFVVYLCGLSSGKRIGAVSLLRVLAASSGGEGCGESEDSSSTDTPAYHSPEGRLTIPAQLVPVTEALHAKLGKVASSTSSAETITVAAGKGILGTAPPRLDTGRGQAAMKRSGKEQSSVHPGAKQLRLEPLSEETQLQPPPYPLDPDLELLIDSVLFREDYVFSEGFWLADYEAVQATADAPAGAEPPAVGGVSERPDASTATGKTVYALQSPSSLLPRHHREPGEERNAEGSLFTDTTGRRPQRGSPAGVEALHSGPGVDATEQANEVYFQAFKADALSGPKLERVTGPGGAGNSLPSSSRASAASPVRILGITLPQQGDLARQLPPGTELPTDANVILHFTWLGNVYPGVPESVLRTHPFYRHPHNQPPSKTRSVDVRFALSYARTRVQANKTLGRCREIMEKLLPSPEDFDDLVCEAERLCGYALGRMPVACPRGLASLAVDTLGNIFLVLDTLHCVAEVLGDHAQKQSWWPLIIRRTESAVFVPKRTPQIAGKRFTNSDVAQTLQVALEYYRRGGRPPTRMVIGLKEALLCEPGTSSKFNGERWNPWREAAVHFRLSVLPGLQDRN